MPELLVPSHAIPSVSKPRRLPGIPDPQDMPILFSVLRMGMVKRPAFVLESEGAFALEQYLLRKRAETGQLEQTPQNSESDDQDG